SRLLGMGDLQSLIEKVKSVTDEKKGQKILEEGKLSLEDVVEQVKSMNSLGGFDKIKSMIPGLGNAKIPEEMLGTQQEKISKWEHIIKSMTPEEKENPEIFDDKKTATSRVNRIARGAGVNNSEIRSLLKQYKMLNTMIKDSSSFDPEKGMNQKQMMKMAKKFMKGKKFKF
ncbi:MAG: signal recognition particle protein Srp19, partial [Nanoarchaeota archaeon]